MKRVFKDLAKDSVEFMSAGRNWRFPRTPTYPYYELMNPPYNSTAPFWRERREEIFAFLREITGKEYVHYLSYSEANDASFAIPMSIASNGPYGFGFIDPGKSFIIKLFALFLFTIQSYTNGTTEKQSTWDQRKSFMCLKSPS
jgi:hypothetical protein